MAAGVVPGPANVLSPETLAEMQEPGVEVPGTTTLQMGRNWFVRDLDGIRAVFHGGDTLGQHADLVMFPDHGVALAILTNAQGGGVGVGENALNAALSQIPELAALVGRVGLSPELSVPPGLEPIELTPDELTPYMGAFADPSQSLTFSLTDDGGLEVVIESRKEPGAFSADILPAPFPAVPVSFVAEDMAALGASRLPFVRDENGVVQWVSMGLRLIPRTDG